MKKDYSLFYSRTLFVALLCFIFFRGSGQTNPALHDLSVSDFSFLGFSAGTITTYPTSMQGWKFPSEPGAIFVAGGDGDRNLEVSTAALTSGNIRNEISDGISLLNSGSNNIGAIVISVNTLNRTGVKVAWSVEDITSANTRQNGIRLQYRIGTSGNFTEVSVSSYLSNTTGLKAKENFSGIELPAEVDNKATVQIRWLYFLNSGSGSRDRLRLDDINITSVAAVGCTAPNIYFATSSYSVNDGSSPFTQTATSNSSGTITYSSSNASSASVNSVTGQITVGTSGSATITATQVASGTFCGGAATYNITVTSSSPVINTTGSISTMSTVYGTASTFRNFSFSANNLTGSQVVATAPAGFEISNADGGSYSNTTNFAVTAGGATGTVYIRLSKNTSAGSHLGVVNLADNANSAAASVSIPSSSVSPKEIIITGISGNNKVYDGGVNATISGTPTYSGLENGESFAVTGNASWAFSTKDVGASLTRAGSYNTPSSNYSITQPTLTANITKKALNIGAPTIAPRVYNAGNLSTGAITVGTLSGFVGFETVTATASGTYANENAGIGKVATIVYNLANGSNGGLASNYSLADDTASGNITKATPAYTTLNISVGVGSTQTIASSISNSPGTLSFISVNPAVATVGTSTGVVSGVAVGSTSVSVTQAESANYLAGNTSVAVDISTVVYNIGDYRSSSDGNWHSTAASNTATWQTYNGSAWVASSSAPPTNVAGLGSKTVYIKNTILLVGTNTAPKVTIENGGVLSTSTVAATFGNLLVRTGGIFNRQGNGSGVSGVFEVEDNATVNFYQSNTASRTSTIWAGNEKFHPNSYFYIKATDNTSNFLVIQNNNDISEYNGACFGNLIIDLGTGSLQLLPSGFNKVLANNLIFRTSTSNIRFSDSNYSFTVLNNIEIESTYGNTLTALTTSGTATINVGGNLIHNGSGILRLANNAGANVTLNVNGNIFHNSGSLDLNAVSGGIGNINLKGNFTASSSASTIAGNATSANFNFTGNGDGSKSGLTQSISLANPSSLSNINFNVNSGAYAKLINQNLVLGSNSKFNVLNGATMDFGFNAMDVALNITGNTGGQAFSVASGSTLKITSPQGITKTANTGNVQVPTTSRIYDAGATYHYGGKIDQSTGNGLPEGITGKVIVDLQTDSTNENFTFTSSGSTKFNTSGVLEIRRGKVIDAPNSGFRNNVVENEDGETDAQKGNLVMAGGRYVVSGSGTKPSLSGNYTLTAGTIEFAGTAATKIRTSVLPKQYWNVDISGTNIAAGGKNFIVNNVLKVISSTGLLIIPKEDNATNPYVVTAKKGIDVTEGGKLLFKNNATLLQDATAINNGKITMEREVSDMNNISTHMDYVYWSSPVNDQIIKGASGFSPNTPSNGFQQYNENTDKFTTTADLTFARAKGYSVRAESGVIPGSTDGETYANGYKKDYTFTGTPHNGSFTSQNLSKSTGVDKGYNLIGNPYPSVIDFDLLYALNNNSVNIYSSAFFWTNNTFTPTQMGSAYKGNNYAIYNGTGGNPATYSTVNTSYGTAVDGKVKIGQAFIVQAKVAGTINFDNSIRLAGTGRFYQKKTAKNRFWLTMTSPAEMVNTILIGYIPGASDAYEKDFDGELFAVGSDSFYSILGAKKLGIQGKGEAFSADDVVPIGNVFVADGNYTIKLITAEGIFDGGQNIYLKDKLLNKYINLSTDSSYTFSATKGTDAARFEIVYKDGTILGNNEAEKSDFIVYKDRETIVIKSSKALGKVEVYDAGGRLVRQLSTKDKKLTIDVVGLPTSIYIIKAENAGDIKTKKIIK